MSVYAWGTGTKGELGTGILETQLDPVVLEGLKGKNIIQVSCGDYHSMALSEQGDLYVWGRGREGQLGNGEVFLFFLLSSSILQVIYSLLFKERSV
jgi:alpha-tubulin suppressor-like RCC1 family protein